MKINTDHIVEQMRSAHAADEERAERRAKHWLTGFAIMTKAVLLRKYIGKITDADIAFLRHDPNIAEAEGVLRKLSAELVQFAERLNLDHEELRLLAQARARIFTEGFTPPTTQPPDKINGNGHAIVEGNGHGKAAPVTANVMRRRVL